MKERTEKPGSDKEYISVSASAFLAGREVPCEEISGTGILLPNDIPLLYRGVLLKELKAQPVKPSPAVILHKIHKLAFPDSSVKVEEIEGKLLYRESLLLLAHYGLDEYLI